MLLVRLDYVVHKRAVLWKEHASDLKGLAVPHLRGPDFDVLLRAFFLFHFCCLESNLGTNTEVGDHVEDDLL